MSYNYTLFFFQSMYIQKSKLNVFNKKYILTEKSVSFLNLINSMRNLETFY